MKYFEQKQKIHDKLDEVDKIIRRMHAGIFE